MSIPQQHATPTDPYRIDFALITITGNITRYKIVRPLVEGYKDVVSRWFPIRTWFVEDPLRILPPFIRLRMRHALDTWKLFLSPPAEAVVIHAFETYYLYVAFARLLRRDTVIIKHPDAYFRRSRPHIFAVKHTDLILPWSNWAADQLRKNFPEVPDEKVLVLHPGINLKDWPMRKPPVRGERFKLLFVGGDFLRKGGDTLIDAFAAHLSDTCELHMATQTMFLPEEQKQRILNTPNAHLYLDLTPASPELKQLYATCDCFVMPTRLDASPWVAIESLASGVPVIIGNVGGIPDIIEDGKTGLLVPPDDPQAIVEAVRRLQASPELVEKMVRDGRAHVEANFDAERNTERFLAIIKSLIDKRRAQRRTANRGRSGHTLPSKG